MTRKSPVSVRILLSVVAIFFVALNGKDAVAVTGGPCTPGEISANKCFVTPISGYSFRVIETGTCGDVALPVTGFPTNLYDFFGVFTGKLWCYQVVAPGNKTSSSLNQVVLSLPLSVYKDRFPGSVTSDPYEKLIEVGPYSVFDYNEITGCQGDSTTGYEIADLKGCGMKWTAKVPSGSTTPAYIWIKTNKNAEPGLDVVEMVPKVGSGVEPGFILGPAAASPYTPTNSSVCQPIEDKIALKITYDEANCPIKVETCESLDCSGICEENKISNVRATIKVNGLGTAVTGKSLKEIGFLLGDKYCRSGQLIVGNDSCGLVNFSGSYVYRCW